MAQPALFIGPNYLPIVVQVEQLVQFVCVCVAVVTFEPDDL